MSNKIVPETWLSKPDESRSGVLFAHFANGIDCATIAIETNNVDMSEVFMDKEQDFNFILEAMPGIKVYKTEAEYKAGNDWAVESYIASGLMDPNGNPDFEPSATAIFSGRIIDTCNDPEAHGFEPTDILVEMTCQGEDFNVIIHNEDGAIAPIEVGNIISGMFWVVGWPV